MEVSQSPVTNPRKTRYTPEEDKAIQNFIKDKNYRNLQEAFDLISTNSVVNPNGRSSESIKQRYRRVLKNKEPLFFMANSNGGMKNTKYIPRNTDPQYKPIEVIMSQLLDLPKDKRDKILNFFKD